MKNLIVLFLIITNVLYLSNISEGNNNINDDDDRRGAIRGIIIDQATGQAMEYANIAIYNSADSSLVTGGITRNNGEFEIKGMPLGEYYIEAHFVGFE